MLLARLLVDTQTQTPTNKHLLTCRIRINSISLTVMERRGFFLATKLLRCFPFLKTVYFGSHFRKKNYITVYKVVKQNEKESAVIHISCPQYSIAVLHIPLCPVFSSFIVRSFHCLFPSPLSLRFPMLFILCRFMTT